MDGRDHAGAHAAGGGFGDELAHRAPGGDDIVDKTAPAIVETLEAVVPLPLDLVVALVDQAVEG